MRPFSLQSIAHIPKNCDNTNYEQTNKQIKENNYKLYIYYTLNEQNVKISSSLTLAIHIIVMVNDVQEQQGQYSSNADRKNIHAKISALPTTPDTYINK